MESPEYVRAVLESLAAWATPDFVDQESLVRVRARVARVLGTTVSDTEWKSLLIRGLVEQALDGGAGDPDDEWTARGREVDLHDPGRDAIQEAVAAIRLLRAELAVVGVTEQADRPLQSPEIVDIPVPERTVRQRAFGRALLAVVEQSDEVREFRERALGGRVLSHPEHGPWAEQHRADEFGLWHRSLSSRISRGYGWPPGPTLLFLLTGEPREFLAQYPEPLRVTKATIDEMPGLHRVVIEMAPALVHQSEVVDLFRQVVEHFIASGLMAARPGGISEQTAELAVFAAYHAGTPRTKLRTLWNARCSSTGRDEEWRFDKGLNDDAVFRRAVREALVRIGLEAPSANSPR